MQIIFDTSVDGRLGARTAIAMLEAFISANQAPVEAVRVTPGVSLLDPKADATPASTNVTNVFTAGDASPQSQAAPPPPPAPSDAAAAQSQNAPAASTVGAPPPPPADVPSAVAPTAPAAGAASTLPASVEIDSKGLPWDERIHAANKAVIADGSWRKKRGLNDAAYVAKVTAELRAAWPEPTQTLQAAPPPPPPAAAQAAPPPPPPAEPAGTTPPPPPAQGNASADFMAWIGGKMSTGHLQFNTVQAELERAGLKSLPDLLAAPDMLPVVRGALEALVK